MIHNIIIKEPLSKIQLRTFKAFHFKTRLIHIDNFVNKFTVELNFLYRF